MFRTLLLVFFVAFVPAWGALIIQQGSAHFDDFGMACYYDPSGAKSVDAVASSGQLRECSNRFTFGYRHGALWFRIDIENRSEQEAFVLRFSEAIWKHLDLYRNSDGRWDITPNGLDVPLKARSVHDVLPAFTITIPPGGKETFYLRGETVASQIGAFELFTADAYFDPSRFGWTHLYIVFAFILGAIALLNIYSYLLTRERVYIYYIGYIIASILFSAMHSGFYLMLGFGGWNEGLHVVGTFVILFLLLFSDRFLNLERRMPKVHGFFRFSAGVFMLFALLIAEGISGASLAFNLYSSLFFSVLFFAAVKIMLRGSHVARYYLMALIVYAPLMGLMILTFNTILPYNDATRHLFLAGALVEIIFFTLILTGKYRALSLEKLRIQKELLQVRERQQEMLETEIDRRTAELQRSNEALSAAQVELEHMAMTDNLTGLYNRNKMDELIDGEYRRAVRYESPFSLILMDVDHFKEVNDTYGRLVGDRVLIDCAAQLRDSLRKSDSIGRWGGEEFLVLAPNTDRDGALALAESMRQKVASYRYREEENITVSLGVAEYRSGENIFDTVRRADEALYRAKAGGRNRVSD